MADKSAGITTKAVSSVPMKRVIFVLLLIVICVGCIATFLIFRARIKSDSYVAEHDPEIATDPSFREMRGAMVPGFPKMPVYPGAVLMGSAQTVPETEAVKGFRAKWTVNSTSVSEVMSWYLDELEQAGWTITPPNDDASDAEQVAHLKNSDYTGFIAAEDEAGETEIVIDIAPVEGSSL